MATIMERIRTIVQSEVSDFVEKHEDPDKVINQTIADAMVTFTNLRKELEPLQANERQARERLDSLTNEANRWHAVARKALAAGNEADARTALSREQDLKERITSQQSLYQQVHEVANTLRSRLAEIEDGINQLQSQAARIRGKKASAKAADTTGDVSEGAEALDRLEGKADWDLAEAEGAAEARRMLEEDPFEALRKTSEAQPSPQTSAKVDDLLAELREQIETEEDNDD